VKRDISSPHMRKMAVLAASVMMAATPISAFAATVLINSFVGTSDRDTRALGIGLQPPDVNGAVGTTQFAQLQNGSFAAYDKNTGALLAPRISDSQFFQRAGGEATGGDVRILFDAAARRWVAIGFGTPGSRIQIAVSDNDNVLGRFRAVAFNGLANNPNQINGVADYPTLALAGDRLVIGTNNFFATVPGGPRNFQGVTVNSVSLANLYAASGPSLADLRQVDTRFPGADNGFAIQGVNRAPNGNGGFDVVAVANSANDLLTYSFDAAGNKSATRFLGGANYAAPRPGRQPDLLNTGNARVVDTLDDRVSSSVYAANGKIYAVHTVTPLGQDHTVVRISVIDDATKTLLSETDITGPDDTYDFYEGSLAVNSRGEFVVGYVRSGDRTHPVDGRISIFARSYSTNANGTITSTSGDILIKQSPVDDYHLGSPQGQPAAGRQRFGDYSSVTLDPSDQNRFYVINQFADFFNNAAGGNPAGTGFARFGTFVGIIGINQGPGGGGGVPEPATWAMMIMGFGFVGNAMRRRRATGKAVTA
jgi:PEP-CTERM motif